MRDYISVSEASPVIASEVIQNGQSKNWSKVNENSLTVAKELERHLAKFNIGYTDPKNGIWSVAKGGTRYFSALNGISFLKNKMGSVLSAVTKK
jgi:hypothetical protein